ncbi:MAG: hypothetical protein WDZ88_02835 [Candidatus Paceibacterota bacterium]
MRFLSEQKTLLFFLFALLVVIVVYFVSDAKKPKVEVIAQYERTEVLILKNDGTIDDARLYCEERGGVFNDCGPSMCVLDAFGERECSFESGCSLTCTYPLPPLAVVLPHPVHEAVKGTRFPVSWNFTTTSPPVLLVSLVSKEGYSWPLSVIRDEAVRTGSYEWAVGISIGGAEREEILPGQGYFFRIDAYDGEVCVTDNCSQTNTSAKLYSATSSLFEIKVLE